MMTIAVVSESGEAGSDRVRVFTENQEASGATLGAAIDALHLTEDAWKGDGEPYLLLRRFGPDRFFSASQRARLVELMAQWREARDADKELPTASQEELEALIEAEQKAMVARSQALLGATRP